MSIKHISIFASSNLQDFFSFSCNKSRVEKNKNCPFCVIWGRGEERLDNKPNEFQVSFYSIEIF